MYATDGEDAVPVIEATAVHDGDETLTVFAVNRAPSRWRWRRRCTGSASPRWPSTSCSPTTTREAANTAEQPDRVAPAPPTEPASTTARCTHELPPRSWNVLRLERAA